MKSIERDDEQRAVYICLKRLVLHDVLLLFLFRYNFFFTLIHVPIFRKDNNIFYVLFLTSK